MNRAIVLLFALVMSVFLSACGGGGSGAAVSVSTARGTLIESPPLRVASLNASDLTAQMNATASGQQLLQLAGTPVCGVDFHYIHYWTVGAQGEATTGKWFDSSHVCRARFYCGSPKLSRLRYIHSVLSPLS